MIKSRPFLNQQKSSNKNKFNNKKNKKRKALNKVFRRNEDFNTKQKLSSQDLAIEEQCLENIVFNTTASFINEIDSNVGLVSVNLNQNLPDNDDDLPNDLFVVDRAGDNRQMHFSEDEDQDLGQNDQQDYDVEGIGHKLDDDHFETGEQSEQELTKKQVWHDEDDDIDVAQALQNCDKMPKLVKSNDKYKQYLERKFTSIYEQPEWAKKALQESNIEKNKSEDESLTFEKTALSNITSSSKNLDKDFLGVRKCSHLNVSSRVKTSLNSVQFHPNSTVALVGSQIGLVRLFQVDGKLNSIIQSIYFQGFRLTDAKFISSNGREEIIVGSDGSNPKARGFCYMYDMLAGKIVRVRLSKGAKHKYSLRGFQISPNGDHLAACDENGNINLLSTSTKELIQEMKINGEVDCLAFSPDSNYLLAHGQQNGGQAFIFDIRNSRSSIPCVNRFNDPDTIVATSMDVSKTSPSSSLVAIGSNMGVVNIYRLNDVVKQSNPPLLKSVMNLNTSISSLKFNHDGQLLLMASDQCNDAIRFLNTSTMSVYKNFPLLVGDNGKSYGRINNLDFSPNSGYCSFVTNHGTAHLYRINHFSSY